MTDTPPSPTVRAATDALRFETGLASTAILLPLVACVIAAVNLFSHSHLPGVRVLFQLGCGLYVFRIAFTALRHLIALSVFHRHIADLERTAFLMESMAPPKPDIKIKNEIKVSDDFDSGSVIDLMSRIKRDMDNPDKKV